MVSVVDYSSLESWVRLLLAPLSFCLDSVFNIPYLALFRYSGARNPGYLIILIFISRYDSGVCRYPVIESVFRFSVTLYALFHGLSINTLEKYM